jgi:hypothetical protein
MKMRNLFTDKTCYDAKSKKLKSVRDGVHEYLGVELRMQPSDKVFKIYRSPKTIQAITEPMTGLPITDEHIPLTGEIDPGLVKGSVKDAQVIEFIDKDLASTIAIQNNVDLSEDIINLVKSGKNQLSLGYGADLIEHDTYDFEQIDIVPHHLALVDKGRCGEICTFSDQKGEIMNIDQLFKKGGIKIAFNDADGAPNLQRIVEIAMALPEAMKTVPVDELQKILPQLEELLAMAKQGDEKIESDEVPGEAEKPADAEGEKEAPAEADAEKPTADAEAVDPAEKDKKIEDEDMPEDKKGKKPEFSDKDFVDAVAQATQTRVLAIEKARIFLPSEYKFTDASMNKLMRDAIATQTSEKFTDAELTTAFKLLKENKQYENFADADKTGTFESLQNKDY